MELINLAYQIRDLRKGQNYGKVIEIWRSQIQERFALADVFGLEHLVADIALSLRKSAQASEALCFLEKGMETRANQKHSARITSEQGWCIYTELKKRGMQAFQQYETSLNMILQTTTTESDYLLHVLLTLQTAETLLQCASPQYGRALMFLDRLRAKDLKAANESKEKEMASDRERWYSLTSKALFAIGNFGRCAVVCSEAVQMENLHYNNQIWFSRRLALCLRKTGNLPQALAHLLEINRRKREWFIQKEIAEIYTEQNEAQKAMDFAMAAAKAAGKMEYKVELFMLLGNLFRKNNNTEAATLHYRLCLAIRQEMKWKIPNELFEALQQCATTAPPPESYRKIFQRINEMYYATPANSQVVMSGTISKILHSEPNADGFIKGTDKISYYFKQSFFAKPVTNLKEGQRVTFCPRQSQYKGKTVMQANEIRDEL